MYQNNALALFTFIDLSFNPSAIAGHRETENKINNGNKIIQCTYCNKLGHVREQCFALKKAIENIVEGNSTQGAMNMISMI